MKLCRGLQVALKYLIVSVCAASAVWLIVQTAAFTQEQPPAPQYPMDVVDSEEATAQVNGALDFIDNVMGPEAKDLTNDLRKALKERRLKLDELGDRCSGKTKPSIDRDAAEEVNYEGPAPEIKAVTLHLDLVQPGKKECFETNPNWIRLMDVLLHEGVHMRQNLWLDNGETLLQYKLRIVEQEIVATLRDYNFKHKVRDIVDGIIVDDVNDRPRTAPKFIEKWNDRSKLSHTDALVLAEQAGIVLRLKDERLERLRKLRKETDPDVICREVKMAWFEIPKDGPVYFVSSYEDTILEMLPLQTRNIPSGVSWPLTLVGGRSIEGRIWVLVAGYSSFELKQGILRLFVDQNCDEQLDTEEGRTLVENDPLLSVPSFLSTDNVRRVFIYDAARAALFPVEDSDGDGIPDTVRFASILAVPQDILSGYRFPMWISGALRVYSYGPHDMATGDAFFQLYDMDGDGIYERAEKLYPSDRPDMAPIFSSKTPLFTGSREVLILGAKNNRVRIEEVNETGKIVLEILGEGKLNNKNYVLVALQRPLRVWRYVRVIDLDNGKVGLPFQVTPPEPRIFSVSPSLLPNVGGQTVYIKGTKLAGAAKVEFGEHGLWKEVPILKRREDVLEVLAPPSPHGAAGGYSSVQVHTRLGGEAVISSNPIYYYPEEKPR